jgi:hypothetical protein
MEFNGYVVTATVRQMPDNTWEASYYAKRQNEEALEQTLLDTFDTRDDAEQHALKLARIVIG